MEVQAIQESMQLLSDKLDHARLVYISFSTFPIGILSVDQMVAEFFNMKVQGFQESMQLLSDKLDHTRLVHIFQLFQWEC